MSIVFFLWLWRECWLKNKTTRGKRHSLVLNEITSPFSQELPPVTFWIQMMCFPCQETGWILLLFSLVLYDFLTSFCIKSWHKKAGQAAVMNSVCLRFVRDSQTWSSFPVLMALLCGTVDVPVLSQFMVILDRTSLPSGDEICICQLPYKWLRKPHSDWQASSQPS